MLCCGLRPLFTRSAAKFSQRCQSLVPGAKAVLTDQALLPLRMFSQANLRPSSQVKETDNPQQSTGKERRLQPETPAEDLSQSDSESLPGSGQHAEFYDSEADDKDQVWAQKQRQGRRSDAVLSCPGCLTTVCIDCQRHEYITTQYRAMFVRNCRCV